MTEPAANKELIDGILQLMDSVRVINEAVDGYRTQCGERGFSPTASEMMAVQLHDGLMRVCFQVKT